MLLKENINPINSLKLISHEKILNELVQLYQIKKLPKVMMFTGNKGIGKFTLINHFLNYIFSINEKTKYNLNDQSINKDSLFYKSTINKTCENVVYIKEEDNKKIKIENIRNLKSLLIKKSFNNQSRFIIIDDVEFLNLNSVNALLKSLEEPSDNNYFILINNKQRELIETISSRCLKTNIYINKDDKSKIISYLIKLHSIDPIIDWKNTDISPGLFIIFNQICIDYSIDPKNNISLNLSKLFDLYQKEKSQIIIKFMLYLVDIFFLKLIEKNNKKLENVLNTKSHIVNNIYDFANFNLNINSTINSINVKLLNV